MRRFLLLLIIISISYKAWPNLKNELSSSPLASEVTNIVSKMGMGEIDYSQAVESFFDGIHEFLLMLDETIEENFAETDRNEINKPELVPPTKNIFSINNIELGDSKQDVEKIVGAEKRSSFNEYGLEWFTYHNNYHNFLMITYDKNNQVAGLYTNQDLISSTIGITWGTPKQTVRDKLGKPLTRFEKDEVFFEFKQDENFDVFLKGNSYLTVFYDIHQNNTVSALQIINKNTEDAKKRFYPEATPLLLEGFEYQLFDLTNSARVNHGLTVLTWNDHVKYTARKHSYDMAKNNYFDHKNLAGESPFERMKKDHVVFTFAGENLAYGQFSSIFAHEGLMNSLGHRENILRKEFKYLGVGVAFNSESHPYFTENFYAN